MAEHLDRPRRSRGHRLAAILVLVVLLTGASWSPGAPGGTRTAEAAGCRIYVAAGDDIPAGHDLNDDPKRYPEKLSKDHLGEPGWCVYNQGSNEQTSLKFINEGGLANAYNKRPDLITIQLGEENNPIVDSIKSCFDKIKDHDFSGAIGCAAAVYGNQAAFDDLKKNYTTILQMTRIMQSQRPQLVTAVVGYANPYPQGDAKLSAGVAQLCLGVIDALQSCLQRWMQLPVALNLLDQVFQKLNQTLKDSVGTFQTGPNGYRWVFVDVYPKFKGHEMKMDVTLKLDNVCHFCGIPTAQYFDNHSSEKNLGSDNPWWIKGETGTRFPEYLMVPSQIVAPPVVIMQVSQTTEGMGKWVDADGQKCIADAIWDADTILPGQTPLKWILGYGEESKTDYCQ